MTAIDPSLRKALTGISGILVTPFDEWDQVAPNKLKPVIDRAVTAGVHILVANGNTGEFYGLTTDEAETMVKAVAEQIGGRVPLLGGVGRSIHDACRLASASRQAGAAALMVHQPPDPFVSPRGVVDYVKRVAEAGDGLPLMLYLRNDGIGLDAIGLPAIFFPAGAQLRGHWHGKTLGSGSDAWKYHAELRAGKITQAQWREMEGGMNRSFGVCMTAGTAATMMLAAEAMGLSLPASASIPSADAGHPRLATETGRRIVDMVWDDWTPAAMLSQASIDNAVTAVMAFGGSTNAIPHLIAMARRAGLELDLDRFDAISRRVPLIANLRPNNGEYLMEDFFYAGGSRAFLSRLGPFLDLDARTVTGRTLGEDVAEAEVYNDDVIRPLNNPIQGEGGLAVLRGNLAPRGAVIKHSAAAEHLLQHTGPAVVFEDYNDMNARIDDPALDVTPDSVLVLKSGGPGMPEWGMLPIPKKMLQQGVRDMVRISDSRMSGTSYGTCILHVAPESHVGGPLAFVQDGDLIRLDTAGRSLDLLIEPEEWERRKAAWTPPPRRYARGYTSLFLDRVGQVDEGCDLDFLEHGAPTPEPEIH